MRPDEGGRFRAPAEWERHSCTWIAWPHNESTFPPQLIGEVEEAYCDMVYEVARGEVVKILVNDEIEAERVQNLLEEVGTPLGNVEFHKVHTVDVWVRDYGPVFVENEDTGVLGGVKWKFNAWGMKYPELAEDDEAGLQILRLSGAKSFHLDHIVEGGAIEVSSNGVLLTTEQCLLDPARNPGLSREDLEAEFRRYLGARDVIWFERGLVGDDTDGHVDVFCRFVSPSTVVLAEEERENMNKRILERAYRKLTDYIEERRAGIEVVRVPCPPPIKVLDQYVPATYLNFYITNSAVLVPVFGVEEDEEALSILADYFPHRRVVGILCKELFYGLGGIHCVTLHQLATAT
ncbi:MAG: agmatine deiminase family protein [Nitrososphaerota archaeon]